MADDLAERFRRGDRWALSKLLTRASRGETFAELPVRRPEAPCRVVAITGSAGVGKSTLVGKLVEYLRRRHLAVAVLACDPQSPLTGGALLGDRFRMPSQPDDGLFIRSLATASGHGGIAHHLPDMLHVLRAFGFDVVLVETVGAGQGDISVRTVADTVVLLVQPEAGDDLQWEKAGILEVADIVVVHKGDLPAADQVEAQVRSMLALSPGRDVPIVRVSSRTGQGIDALWAAVLERPPRAGQLLESRATDDLSLARCLLEEAIRAAAARDRRRADEILAHYRAGTTNPRDTAMKLLRVLQQLV